MTPVQRLTYRLILWGSGLFIMAGVAMNTSGTLRELHGIQVSLVIAFAVFGVDKVLLSK